ncbi:MAG: hypothetical protein K0M60_13265 [Hydrogenophaga sp.]|nr:hypothetical protein [Hydrogenophaga sp.]
MEYQVANIPQIIRRTPRKFFRRIWDALPETLLRTELMRQSGRFIYRHFTRDTVRVQSHYTWFMRNPPLLKALSVLVNGRKPRNHLKVASIGCSTGAELYSLLYILRRDHPDLVITGAGIDLSAAVVHAAQAGIYRPDQFAAANALFVEGRPEVMSADISSLAEILEQNGDGTLSVHDWLKEGTRWLTGDATDPNLMTVLPQQDIVLVNNVIGPMEDAAAEACLLNVMKLVLPGGYLVVDGIDLDLKTRIMMGSDFAPARISQESIWNADTSKIGWPWIRWGREPWDNRVPNSRWRYSCVFERLR